MRGNFYVETSERIMSNNDSIDFPVFSVSLKSRLACGGAGRPLRHASSIQLILPGTSLQLG